jgi:endonuclease-3
MTDDALSIHMRLLSHYGSPQWYPPRPPLDELILTILSQNTNDRNRDRAYERLRERFPSWKAVRDAKRSDVIEAIRPAGLANQKGARIQTILRAISDSTDQEKARHGEIDLSFLSEMAPEEVRRWLLQFKGVGPKTAAIVMQFSLGIPAFPVDTHIYRVSGRIGLRPAGLSVEQTHEYLARRLPSDTYAAAHLNLIRLGREICLARRPRCPICPVQDLCDYVKNG